MNPLLGNATLGCLNLMEERSAYSPPPAIHVASGPFRVASKWSNSRGLDSWRVNKTEILRMFKLPSQKISLLLPSFFVLGSCVLHGFPLRDFSYRHIPPGFVARDPHLLVHLHHDDGRTVLTASFFERSFQIAASDGANGLGAQAGGVRYKIHRQGLPIQLAAVGPPIAKIGAKAS